MERPGKPAGRGESDDGPAPRIAAFGECLVELHERGGVIRQAWGGDTLNTLIYLARLVPALRGNLHYLTALGDDPFSEQMLNAWEHEGIGTSLVRRIRGRLPGLYYIRTDPAGERRFFYWRDRAAVRSVMTRAYRRRAQKALEGFDGFYFSGISLAVLPQAARERFVDLVGHLHQSGTRVIFDSNFRPALWQNPGQAATWMERLYPGINVALVSFEDEKRMFPDRSPEDTCRRLMEAGIEEVVVKNGHEPCTVSLEGRMESFPLNIRVKPVDTTAAGDAFNAAYIAARLRGEPARRSVALANHLASQVVQFPGAIMPRERTPPLDALS